MSEAEGKPWTKIKRRSRWLLPLYDRPAWSVSPVLVDIEAAYRTNRIDSVIRLASQIKPQLHASFIDTCLSASGLAEHLRQFTYFVDPKGCEFTLRIADCLVVPWLHQVMTASQWGAIHKPILRWRVHSLDGKLWTLPCPDETHVEPPPLHFTAKQLSALDACHEPNQLMHNLRAMRFGHQWAETPQLEIQLAEKILSLWKGSGQTDRTNLLLFARGVFDSKGRLLDSSSLRQVLAHQDAARFRRDLNDAVARCEVA